MSGRITETCLTAFSSGNLDEYYHTARKWRKKECCITEGLTRTDNSDGYSLLSIKWLTSKIRAFMICAIFPPSVGTEVRRKMLESAEHVPRKRQTSDEVLLEILLWEPHRSKRKMETVIVMENSAIGCSGS